jgi:hypothetical protein
MNIKFSKFLVLIFFSLTGYAATVVTKSIQVPRNYDQSSIRNVCKTHLDNLCQEQTRTSVNSNSVSFRPGAATGSRGGDSTVICRGECSD